MDKRVVDRVRKILNLPESISDAEIIEKTKKTHIVAFTEMHFASEDFRNAVIKELSKISQEINRF